MPMKNMKRKFQRCVTCLIAVLLAFSGILLNLTDVRAVSSLGTVTVAVERFTIGQGYLIEPYTMEIQQGDTYEDICRRMLEENGYKYSVSSSKGFYLEGISGADEGTIKVPSCIRSLPAQKDNNNNMIKPPDNSAVNEYAGNNAWLGEFSYSFMSGWMYSVGNNSGYEFPGVGMDQYKAQDGDVFRLQFTLWGYGTDLSGSDVSGNEYYKVGDKTELTRKIAQINQDKDKWFAIEGCKTAYDNAIKQLQKVEVYQKDLDKALEALPEEEPILPESISLNSKSANLTVGDTILLIAEVKPDNVNQLTLNWSSTDSDVAQVDQNGNVTAKAPGEADINVTTQNGKKASCHVKVEDRYIEKIILNMASASLEKDESFVLSVKSYEPSNATETLIVTYESSNSDVASVGEDGTVTAHKSGNAEITVKTRRGVSAVCRVTVGNAQELAEAIEKKINKLPSAAYVDQKNAQDVMDVWYEFSALSEKAQEYVSAEAADKLKKSKTAAEKILEKLENVAKVNQLLSELPAMSEVRLGDADKVAAARDAYEKLTQEEKGKVDENLYAKLLNLERSLKELEKEITNVQEQVNALPESITLEDADTVLAAWDNLQSLSEEQLGLLGEDIVNRLNDAAEQMLACVETAVQNVNITGTPDLTSDMVVSFIAASNACEGMDDELTGRISQDTLELMQKAREWIGSSIHNSGQLSLTASWFIQLDAEDTDAGSAVKKKVESQFSSLASVLMAKTIRYEDIREQNTYEPEKAMELTVDLSGTGEAANRPIAVTAEISKDNKITLKELNTAFDADNNTISFKTKHVGLLLILDAPIDVTGITVPKTTTVGKGETLALNVKYTPSNATINKELKFKSSDSTIVEVDKEGTLKGIKPGSAAVTVSLKSNTSVKAKCKVTVTDKANDLNKSVKQVLTETSSYALSIDTNPTIGSEWFVLGHARGGMDLDSAYFSTYYNHVANYIKEKNGKLTDGAKYTEYSKMIIIMTAIGKDARDIAGYNLFENLADFKKITGQGFNGPIWALIALNSKEEYSTPEMSGVAEQTTEDKLINYILDRECSGGGWAMTGDEADSDITGMTLQALAPYYKEKGHEDITKAVNRALDKLGSMQNTAGGYLSMNAETSESAAQVLTGLCSLGIDPRTDSRFIKNGHWIVENLISYHIDGSGFMHVKAGAANNGGGEAGKVNGMATEQGYYALVAYQRLLDGKTSLYDMSDLTVKPGEEGDGSGTGVEDTEKAGTDGTSGTGSNNNSSGGGSPGTTANTSSKKTTGKTAASKSSDKKTAKKEKKKEDTWSFDGGTYTAKAEDTDTGTAEAEEVSGSAEQNEEINSGSGFGKEVVPYVMCVLCGVAVVGVCVYFKKKG